MRGRPAAAIAAVALAVSLGAGALVLNETEASATGQLRAVPAADAAASAPVYDFAAATDETPSRDGERPALDYSAVSQRQQKLTQQASAIKGVQKAAADKKKAEDAARRKLEAAQGYKPGTTDPREIARQMMKNKYNWGEDQFKCFDKIIIAESNWKWYADNPTSSAYGIPQALPGHKMASAGPDWKTNPATQIKWGLGYVKERYGTPCQALSFRNGAGWY